MTEANTSNYLSVALEDDKAAGPSTPSSVGGSGVSTPPTSGGDNQEDAKAAKRAAREKRIAAAVERSRTEYKEEHAYTERDWLDHNDPSTFLVNTKPDSQKFEQMLVSLYYRHPPEYASIVQAIQAAIDPDAKPKDLGGLSREMLDLGLRSAMGCRDQAAAGKFARLSKPLSGMLQWRHQLSGLALNASEALSWSGHTRDAILPLLMSTEATGLHLPILVLLLDVLERLRDDLGEAGQGLHGLTERVRQVAGRRQTAFDRPLFPDRPYLKPSTQLLSGSDLISQSTAEFNQPDELAKVLDLDDDGRKALEATLNRLDKALRGGDVAADEVSRGVREL